MYWALMPYVAISTLYLVSAWRKGRLVRVLKPLLMPSLLAGYMFMARPPQALIVAGLALGFVGDVALMLPEERWGGWGLLAGLGAFLLGHVMYLVWFCQRLDGALAPATLIYLPVAAGMGVGMYRRLRGSLRGLDVPVALYEAAILIMSTGAFALLLARPGAAAALIWLGSACFVVSDSVLAQGIFIGQGRRGGFIVMITYILAQLGIALGAALLG